MDNINAVLEQIQEMTNNTAGGLGYAAALSWIYSIIILAIIGVAALLFRERKTKIKHYIWG